MAMPIALGLAGYAFFRHRQTKRTSREPVSDDFAIDPLDSVQSFEKISDLEVATLDVDALTREDIAAAQDLAALETASGQSDAEFQDPLILLGTADEVVPLEPSMRRDAGDLYGVHTPRAVAREHPDDDRAFDEGQNWVEALEASAIENGPEPERELDDIIDDENVLKPPHASTTRDRPIADQGSGGRRGL